MARKNFLFLRKSVCRGSKFSLKECIYCGIKFNNNIWEWECPACHKTPELSDDYLVFAPELTKSNSGFRAEYFSQLACLEAKHFWFCSRNQLILSAIKQYFSSATNFFEIGCGTGFVLSAIEKRFPSFSLYGSDIYIDGLNFAKQRLQRAALFQMDARKIPFKNEFDVIGAFDIIEHIKDDELVLSQMYSATNEKGGIILTVPQHKFLWSQFDTSSCHIRRYGLKELQKKVTNAGFHIIDSIPFVSLLLPLMIFTRLGKKVHNNKYDIMKDLTIKKMTNNILEKVLNCERYLINRGIRFPFGGSLLLIARKSA
ncbi:MAG: class I SAM-dependent methyltransferase [Candidatus Omnitrophota bacterium]|jgi:SAM-dependent methyltransferase